MQIIVCNYQAKAEEKVAELSASIVKVESEAKIEKEKNHYLKSEKEDLESTRISSEYKVCSVLSPPLLKFLLRLKCNAGTILSKGLNTF